MQKAGFTFPLGYGRKFFQAQALALAFASILSVGTANPTEARSLKLTRLEAPRAERLTREARQQYDLALAAVDRIMYEDALKQFQTAVQLNADDDHLRFMVVQLATYLGDTRWGSQSTTFYTVAADNLQVLTSSPRLNLREQARAKEALDKINALLQSIAERDEKRREWGIALAKTYQRELQKGTDKAKSAGEQDVEKRKKLLEASGEGGLGTVGNFVGGVTGSGVSTMGGRDSSGSTKVRSIPQPESLSSPSSGKINAPSTPDLTGEPITRGPEVNANDAASPTTGAPTDASRNAH